MKEVFRKVKLPKPISADDRSDLYIYLRYNLQGSILGGYGDGKGGTDYTVRIRSFENDITVQFISDHPRRKRVYLDRVILSGISKPTNNNLRDVLDIAVRSIRRYPKERIKPEGLINRSSPYIPEGGRREGMTKSF